jgi:hypothetical protein
MVHERAHDEDGHSLLDEDLELADARLEWAKASRCLDIPEQATAMKWHAEACAAARDAATADGAPQE